MHTTPVHSIITISSRTRTLSLILALAALSFCAQSLSAQSLALPREARAGLDTLYGGDPDAAIEIFRRIETSQPDSPLGYLLEGEARWWKIFCGTLEFRWGQLEAAHREPAREDDAYLNLADKAVSLAESQLHQKETAELHLYAGMGYALRAKLVSLRNERRATARAGVSSREHFLRAKELDAKLADADTGLGLYNYYVDTLSAIARILRFFMGIPGGDKQVGIAQLENAMERGEITAVDARFYLSKNLRTYDQQYERAAVVLEPLTVRYPHNAIFALMLGNLNALLNRKEKAVANYRIALEISQTMPATDPECKARVIAMANTGLAMVGAK